MKTFSVHKYKKVNTFHKNSTSNKTNCTRSKTFFIFTCM